MLTFEQIKELIELVSRHGLAGLEVERAGLRVRITGHGQSAPAPVLAATAAPAASSAASAPGTAAVAAGAAAPSAGAHVLNSPIVGTFYRAPAPNADPYVEVGSRVQKGQVLCIIEAMKLMNEIESDAAGVIVEIYPQNAQAVEFGEPLFAIRPD